MPSRSSFVTNYKNLQVKDIEFTVPEKIKGKYVSYVVCNKFPLYVQTPTAIVHRVSEDTVQLQFKADSPFVKMIKDFDDHCATCFSRNSTKFFNGKVFSVNKIKNAYRTCLDDENCTLSVKVDPTAVIIRDQRDVQRSFDDISVGTEAIAVIDVEQISIGKSSIHPVLTLQQMKIYIKERLTNWCIQHESDSEDEAEPTIDEKDVEQQIKALEAVENVCINIKKRLPEPTIEKESASTEPVSAAEPLSESQKTSRNRDDDDDKDFY
jgi:hypothetical protein